MFLQWQRVVTAILPPNNSSQFYSVWNNYFILNILVASLINFVVKKVLNPFFMLKNVWFLMGWRLPSCHRVKLWHTYSVKSQVICWLNISYYSSFCASAHPTYM
ncbi:hypothetical protein ACOSQ3_018374 [Xanthoceras sorbifolium]